MRRRPSVSTRTIPLLPVTTPFLLLTPPPPRALGGRLHHRSKIPMTIDEMMGLKPLDIIRHKTNADAFIVHRVSVDMLREGMAVTGHKIREIGRASCRERVCQDV